MEEILGRTHKEILRETSGVIVENHSRSIPGKKLRKNPRQYRRNIEDGFLGTLRKKPREQYGKLL